ncbi:conserved hypothetical protein [Sphingomonas sp. EC-HK361]|uniref:PP2C family protein-serine/threonine phosphatase n=1 Tax=Sphingomonas sp. EC-HK361 TaxID=2038397 RepID=UPI00125C4523|nr:protein phosphatase 2C domain-containing protein [Sphingomonas sp. EC-HK361]VVT24536.1 conserved hypothetical protein [Sphingomonas sp. EC-HK361]
MRLSRLFARREDIMDDAATPTLTSGALTHVGLVRQVNEDRLLDRPDRGLWAVADGMGGHGGGDLAATRAMEALQAAADAPEITCASVRAAIDTANATIVAENARTGGQSGATIVALRIEGSSADILWAGDSRAYRIRAGRAEQISHDHSVVQDLVDAGLIAAEDAERHPRAHVVTRALGVGPAVDIAHRHVDVLPGDRFLLCSDGFSRSLPLADLAREVTRPGQTGRELLRRAVERDGSDNVSLVLVTVGG